MINVFEKKHFIFSRLKTECERISYRVSRLIFVGTKNNVMGAFRYHSGNYRQKTMN